MNAKKCELLTAQLTTALLSLVGSYLAGTLQCVFVACILHVVSEPLQHITALPIQYGGTSLIVWHLMHKLNCTVG